LIQYIPRDVEKKLVDRTFIHFVTVLFATNNILTGTRVSSSFVFLIQLGEQTNTLQ